MEFPIAADPEDEVVYQRWEVRRRPEQRPKTCVSHWAKAASYIGNRHPVSCQLGMRCVTAGIGWFLRRLGSEAVRRLLAGLGLGPRVPDVPVPGVRDAHGCREVHPYLAPVESSAALAEVTLTGEEMYEVGDRDIGEVDDLTAVAASVGTRPACKRIRWTKHVFGQGGGHLESHQAQGEP